MRTASGFLLRRVLAEGSIGIPTNVFIIPSDYPLECAPFGTQDGVNF